LRVEPLDLRLGGSERSRYLEGVALGYDWSGRGAAAVWRAGRRVELQDFEDWLMRGHGPNERQVMPPGWLVHIPDRWHSRVLPTTSTKLPEPFATWLSTGRLLTFSVGEKQVLWPLAPNHSAAGGTPVPGFEPIIRAASVLRSDQTTSFIEAMLVDWSWHDDDLENPPRLEIPADKAYEFGLIEAEERRRAMAQARAATLRLMTDTINGLPAHKQHRRAELQDVRGNTRLFRRAAERLEIRFSPVRATWTWPGRSIADEVLAGARADAVQWLAAWVHRSCKRMLQQSMEQAWRHGFDHLTASHWVPQAPPVTPTNTDRSSSRSTLDADPPF
jgi:hypothetical protein